jgi:peptidylprolyl isomerase
MFQSANEGDTVRVHYTGRLADGTIFDTSRDKSPLLFILGRREVIPGFDDAVRGMVRGEIKKAAISAGQAYGESQPELIEEFDREALPAGLELRVGAQLEVTRQDGSTFLVMVDDLTETTVTLDANHPLAGKDLFFEIELLEIRPASQAC